MIDVVVSAVLGAVVGSGLTIFGSYVQLRMNRAEERHSVAREVVKGLWLELHERQQSIHGRQLGSPGWRRAFDADITELAARIAQLAMITRPQDQYGPRLLMLSDILHGVAGSQGNEERDLCHAAIDVIVYAQWICAATLTGDPQPAEPARMPEYREQFVRG
ncbi:hypothetical protein CcI49_06015 [Frankia sp. CcI49]|uniref:hypothetical protein n=1 Tax=unclassified Frankia TaxID=2632575 RepID=UPI0006CA397D|nr:MULTISPECIES: hypothetical protein [unclassified Frankia]KPM54308.1 hypothetical protein ACG83_20290 [Frankia sp. R43]ONH61728.1 hypothetical protein CcI49_06015 [Frankia sp. CcI49]